MNILQIHKNIEIIPESEDDYIVISQLLPEKARDNIQYILRGQKMIKLPVSKAGWLSPTSFSSLVTLRLFED